MNSTEVLDGFATLLAADIDHLDRDEVAALVASSARLRSWHDSIDLRCARRTRELQAEGRAESPESMFGRSGNRSSKESDAVARRSEVGDEMSSFGDGLACGDVSSGHLDAMANVRGRLDDETREAFDRRESELRAAAGKESVDAFARRCRELARRVTAATSDADELDKQRARSEVKRWVDKTTGMHITRLELDPLRDAAVWAEVNDTLATLRQLDGNAGTPWPQMRVNAFVATMQGGLPIDGDADVDVGVDVDVDVGVGGCSGAGTSRADATAASLRRIERRVPEVTVLTELGVLTGEFHEHGICETEDGEPLPASTVRRLCCDAEIIPAVLGGDGELLDLGRSERTVNRAQRRALRALHRTCGHPDCTVGFSICKVHHVRWWKRDRGPTDIDNLLPLCEKHHHLVHEGRWTLTMTPARVATWARPDGSIHHVGSTIDRRSAEQSSSDRAAADPRRAPVDSRPTEVPMLS